MTTMTIESIVKQMDLKPAVKLPPKEPLKMIEEVEEKADSVAPPAEPAKYFSFDKRFQEQICQAFLIDRNWALQFAEVLNVDFFQYAYLKKIAHTYMAYGKKYKEFPSMSLLATIIVTDLKNNSDAALRGQIHDFLIKVEENKDLGDLGYVKEKSLDFCKRVGLQKALEASIEFIETEKYEKVVDTIKKAINAGNEHSPGLELCEDVDARYSETYRKTIPTGIAQFDERKILNGGLGAGELGVVVSPTGVGKSHLLVNFGASALLAGKNVLHYTFELNERATGIRYDSNLLDIDSIDCFAHKDKIKKFYEDNVATLGRLKIKYYSTGEATVSTLRSHIDKLGNEGFRPELIIIDYAGIMRSTEKFELLRLELKKVFEELRGFASEMDCPIWTAVQSNKDGANKDFIDVTNMAEAYGQAHVADFIVGLARKSLAKSTGYGNVFIAKNRAGIDGIQLQIHLDTARSKLRVISESEFNSLKANQEEDEENGMKNQFRQKVREFQKNSH
jgi:hypothetical protein